jgi:hypothetical protein
MAVSPWLMPVQTLTTHIEPETIKTIETEEVRPLTLEEMIRERARINNLNEEKIIYIARCESQLNHQAVGDGNLTCASTKKPMRSRGLWQINECGHPEISDEQAFDPVWSTDWAMEVFKKGEEAKEWQRCTNKYLSMI